MTLLDECWKWGGYSNGRYGVKVIGRRKHYTHRLAWVWANGQIPEGMYVLHRCDNTLCCNPKHLFVGTPKQNMADMVLKGRHRNQQKTHCPSGHEYTGDNLRRNYLGRRVCRACERKARRRRYLAIKTLQAKE